MRTPTKLSEWPWVVVRIECKLCPRKGSYRLARLAAQHGPDMPIERLLAEIAGNCPRWPDTMGGQTRCGAMFADLNRITSPDSPGEPVHRTKPPSREDVPQRRRERPNGFGTPPMLSGWPSSTIVLSCEKCGRHDVHQVGDLLKGGDMRLTDLSWRLTRECTRRGPNAMSDYCGARFV